MQPRSTMFWRFARYALIAVVAVLFSQAVAIDVAWLLAGEALTYVEAVLATTMLYPLLSRVPAAAAHQCLRDAYWAIAQWWMDQVSQIGPRVKGAAS